MERRSFLRLLAVAAMSPSIPVLGMIPEHKNQTLLRMMDDCIACNNSKQLQTQKLDDMLLFINQNYGKPLNTEEEITQIRNIISVSRSELATDLIRLQSINVLEIIFPVAVIRDVIVNTRISPSELKNFYVFSDLYYNILLLVMREY